MKVVIDTNALLPVLSATHPFAVIRKRWARGVFTWALSTEIILEYQEIAEPRIGPARWREFEVLLEVVGNLHHNVEVVSPTYRFSLTSGDPDDNKFADCAIVADADFIITSDRHFQTLIGSGFKPQPITPEEFIQQFC